MTLASGSEVSGATASPARRRPARLRRMGVILVVLGLAGAAPAAAAGGAWPMYGHDLSNSRDAGAGPSAGSVGSMHQAWVFKSSHGDFTGTPVVADGVLVAGTNLGSIFALDAVTGKVRWSKDVGQQINGSAAIDPNAPGGAIALVPVARAGSPYLLALSLRDGSVRWKTALSVQPSSANADVFGSPAYWKGTVYMGTSGPNGDGSTARGSVVALNESTGKVRWRTYTVPPGDDGGAVWSTPAIDTTTGRLYVGTGNAYHSPAANTTDSILALNAATGHILGHFQAEANDTFAPNNPAGPDADFGASPNLFRAPGGRLLVGEGAKNGTYYALDRKSMQLVWSNPIAPGSPVLGGITGSTAYDGARIYGSNVINSEIWALGRDGSPQWLSADTGTLDFSPLTVANGVLYTADSAGFLTARNPSTGMVLASFPLGQPTFGGITAVGRAVYVAVGTGPPPGAPQQDGSGSIVAFGDTSFSGAPARAHSAIRLSVHPRSARVGTPTRFHFHATTRSGGHTRAVAGATVTFDGHQARTGSGGYGTITATLTQRRTYQARAHKSGFRDGHAAVRGTRAATAPRFTG